jgi:hypothetical protein
MTTTTAISQPLVLLLDWTTVVRSTRASVPVGGTGLKGSLGFGVFTMKVSSAELK